MVADYSTGKRVRRYFPDVESARAEAVRICELLNVGDAEGAAMTGTDRAELHRCRAIVKPHGVTVQEACETFSKAADLVGPDAIVRTVERSVSRR